MLERDVLQDISPAGTVSSIERDVFPRLVGKGLFGHPASGYWLDIGTPERYLKATFDLLDGNGRTESWPRAPGPASDDKPWIPF